MIIGNILKGAGYTLYESGRLVEALGGEISQTASDAVLAPWPQSIHAEGRLVRLGDDLRA
jgi:hypothetical protein